MQRLMRRPVPILLFFAATGLLVLQTAVFAATPQATKVQGLLTDRISGSPVPAQGPYNMIFSIWDAAIAGAQVRSLGPMVVQASQGLFEVELPLTSEDFAGSERYLEITVNGQILAPRQRLVSTPFSFKAETTQTASSADTAGLALQVAAGSIGPAGLANGSVTADKLGIPCSLGETLVKGPSGWGCAPPPSAPICSQGSFINCYTGPAGTLNVGACHAGSSPCTGSGSSFGPCQGQSLPQPEVCDGIDNDCDGLVDEGLGTTTCGSGTCARTINNCVGGALQVCTPQPDGAACDDGRFCTLGETCSLGVCGGGAIRDCNDGLFCNTDSCNVATDQCEHPCTGPTQLCADPTTHVTCTGIGPSCGEAHETCSYGVCLTTAPGGCTRYDTCANPYVISGLDFGPTTFNDDMSHYTADVAGSCGSPGNDVIHQITIPTTGPAGAFTAFSTIVVDASATTAIDTASHITTSCGNPAAEPQYASIVCGASTGSGAACANAPGTGEVLRACGMPTGTYFATLDSSVSAGPFSLTLQVHNVSLDTCPDAGNVSSLSTVTNTTTGKANNYSYSIDSPALGNCSPGSRNACGESDGSPDGSIPICLSDGGAAAEDIVFYYVAAASGFLTVTTQGSSFDTILYVKTNCLGNCSVPGNCLKCNDDHNIGLGGWSEIYRLPVTAGTLYYIVVDGRSGQDGMVKLNLSFSSS